MSGISQKSGWYFGDLGAFVATTFSLRMRISVYLGGSIEKSHIGVWFLDPDFLVNGEILGILPLCY